MRLIDADALKYQQINSCCEFIYRYEIEQQPTIEAVPAVHSTWVWVPRNSRYGKKSGEWRCKRCNGTAHGGLSPYCGKCGAKMKLEEDTHDPT